MTTVANPPLEQLSLPITVLSWSSEATSTCWAPLPSILLHCAQAADTCGAAKGTLDSNSQIIDWESCDYGSAHGTNRWIAIDSAGEGCLNGYDTVGNVHCTDDSITLDCSAGGLLEGDNPLEATHNQPLNSFEFSSDYDYFVMDSLGGPSGSPTGFGVETPSESDSRTWLLLEGELIGMELTETPECLCE